MDDNEYKVLRTMYLPVKLDDALREKLRAINERRRKNGEKELNRSELITQMLEQHLREHCSY